MTLHALTDDEWQPRTDRSDGADEVWVPRVDRGELLHAVQRPDGTMLVEGFAAREGVLEYRRPDGTVFRELVTAEVLADSAAGLARVPVTLEHPDLAQHPHWVTPDNVSELGVGDTDGEVVVEDGGFVRVKLAVRRRDAITAVRRGKRELSPGYGVVLDMTPGVHPDHGRYDAIQRKRRYNHLAITDLARGGREVRLRADGAVATTTITAGTTSATGAGASSSAGGPAMLNARLIALLSMLGITQRFDSDDGALDAINDAMRRRQDDAGKAEQARTEQLATVVRERDEARTQLAAVTAERDRERARADAATTELGTLRTKEQERADADERRGLEDLAQVFDVDPKAHTKNGDLKRAIAAAYLGGLGSEARSDASDPEIDGVLLAARASRKSQGRQAGSEAWAPNGGQRGDAGDAGQARVRRGPGAASRQRYREAFEAGTAAAGR